MTLKKVILRGFLGIPIGIFINVTISLIISLIKGELIVTARFPEEVTPLTAFTTQYIISMFLGFMFAAASAIFEIDTWSISKQTAIHFVIISMTFLPCAVLARWLDPNFINILVYFGIFVAIYIIIWITQYFAWKSRITKLNRRLENK
jgi:hypothetical protein